jgi:hypothetical protein
MHLFISTICSLAPLGEEIGVPNFLLFSRSQQPELLRRGGYAMREACGNCVFALFGAMYFVDGTWRKGALDGWIRRDDGSDSPKSSVALLMEKKIFCQTGHNPVNILMDDVRKLNSFTKRYFTSRLPNIRTKTSRLRVEDDGSVGSREHSKETRNVELSHLVTVSISRVRYGVALKEFVPELEEEVILSEANGYATKDEARSRAISDALRVLKIVVDKYFASNSIAKNVDDKEKQDSDIDRMEEHTMGSIADHEEADDPYVYVDFSPYDMSSPFPHDHVVDVHDMDTGKRMYQLKVVASGEIQDKEDVEEEDEAVMEASFPHTGREEPQTDAIWKCLIDSIAQARRD